jgi:glycosyltransferase involved in cell wall biosynthesis
VAGCTVVAQKSLREGFGLTVTEAMWKGNPVVGGAVGGIRRQIIDGVVGFSLKARKERRSVFDSCWPAQNLGLGWVE